MIYTFVLMITINDRNGHVMQKNINLLASTFQLSVLNGHFHEFFYFFFHIKRTEEEKKNDEDDVKVY